MSPGVTEVSAPSLPLDIVFPDSPPASLMAPSQSSLLAPLTPPSPPPISDLRCSHSLDERVRSGCFKCHPRVGAGTCTLQPDLSPLDHRPTPLARSKTVTCPQPNKHPSSPLKPASRTVFPVQQVAAPSFQLLKQKTLESFLTPLSHTSMYPSGSPVLYLESVSGIFPFPSAPWPPR